MGDLICLDETNLSLIWKILPVILTEKSLHFVKNRLIMLELLIKIKQMIIFVAGNQYTLYGLYGLPT